MLLKQNSIQMKHYMEKERKKKKMMTHDMSHDCCHAFICAFSFSAFRFTLYFSPLICLPATYVRDRWVLLCVNES